MAASIFISYRRLGSIKDARAIYERLRNEFGARNVFMDLEGLAFGEDFIESLERHLAGCRVMLALIGPQWLGAVDGQGRRRLDDPDDFVRIELGTALARPGVRVVPVLLDGADLPVAADLPEDLRPLRRRHYFTLRDISFDADMRQLCAGLRSVVEAPAGPPQASAAGRATAAVPTIRKRSSPPAPAVNPPAWASTAGEDAAGRWAEFTLDGIVQRLRWIVPGEFLMGSPTSEDRRFDDEGPQHQVRVSRGFWLADTACTQALWLAVMGGDNPSRFKDPLNPVERVSHEDVERFLSELARKLGPAAAPMLPTEAQWEYACRAGTTTPFSFGATVTPQQANYDGKSPYIGAADGLHRGSTVPVKSMPANDWGLFQMHGNVWEWCADGLRTYPEGLGDQFADDPAGPQEQGPEARRVVRGGSWIRGAVRMRSAYRFTYQRRDADDDLGFRFALRS